MPINPTGNLNFRGLKLNLMRSSNSWLNRHMKDRFVRQSLADNYRSRSAYKLLQINEKYPFLKSGQIILDCCAAPGGWTQVAANLVEADVELAENITNQLKSLNRATPQDSQLGLKSQDVIYKKGLVISVDLLPFAPVPGAVSLFPLDFQSPQAIKKIQKALKHNPLDVILSDMAPNMSGQRDADHWNSMV